MTTTEIAKKTTYQSSNWLDRYLADPDLPPKAFIRKRLIWIWVAVAAVCIMGMTSLAAFRGMDPVTVYGLALLACYAVYLPLLKYIRRFELANFLFSCIIVLITFATILYVGGISNSFGLYLVGLTCAMSSMLCNNRQWTIYLFLLYGLTIILAALLQPWLSIPPEISDADRVLFYVLNILWISASTLFFTLDYIDERGRFEEAETARIRELDKIKTKVYTNITHEFRTPLTLILGMAAQIEKAPEQWLNRRVRKIREYAHTLLHLVNQMLDLSKLETGALPVHLVQGDIIAFLRYLAESFQAHAQERAIDFAFTTGPDTLTMDYDPDKLRAIVSNLLSNALKYTPAGGQVRLAAERETAGTEQLILRVQDTGIGIEPDKIDQIFERFFRVDDGNASHPGGSGLGLTLTRELVKLLRGEISVVSMPGRGTEFTVRLPVTRTASRKAQLHPEHDGQPSPEPVLQTAATELSASRKADRPLLLIVEDNSDVIDYLSTLLRDHYCLETAPNGRQGLEKAIQLIPDIILSDVMMPEMDGFELLQEVKTDWRTSHIPVVLLTAKADSDSRLEGLAYGADAYLAKPFNEAELMIRLRQLIALRRRLQQRYGGSNAITAPDPDLKREDDFIARLQQELEQHLDQEDFGVDALAKALSVSRSQLYRKLLALTGQPVNRYILSYRLQRARQFLETTDLNVTEAALEAGFKNLSHFSHAFHEKFGLPPSAIQRNG